MYHNQHWWPEEKTSSKAFEGLDPGDSIGCTVEAVLFDYTLGEIKKVIEGVVNKD